MSKTKKEHVAIEQYANIKFGKLYTIEANVLGTGSFGVAMICQVRGSLDVCVAKIVNIHTSKHKNPTDILQREVDVYKQLVKHRPLAPYLIKMYRLTAFRNHHDQLCHALVMEYGGKDLDKILKARGQFAFSRSQLMRIGLELVPALQAMHTCNIVHRDIKPANIVLRFSRSRCIFKLRLIDYGLATTWTPDNEPRRTRRGAGTPRFCAYMQHFGYAGSPARDMEAFIYTLIYLSGKQLPWHGLNISDPRRKTRTIAYTKRDANARLLCVLLDEPSVAPRSHTKHDANNGSSIPSSIGGDHRNNSGNRTDGSFKSHDSIEDHHESESNTQPSDVGCQPESLANILTSTRLLKYHNLPNYKKIQAYFKQTLDRADSDSESLSSNSILCQNLPTKNRKRHNQAQQTQQKRLRLYQPHPHQRGSGI